MEAHRFHCSVGCWELIPARRRRENEKRPERAEETANCPSSQEKCENKIDATGKRYQMREAQN